MLKYQKLKEIYDEIDILIEKRVKYNDPDFIKWQTKAKRFIQQNYGDGSEAKDFANTVFRLNVWTPGTPEESWIRACKEGLINTKAKFEVYLEELTDEEIETRPLKGTSCVHNNKVFIVHGHDGETKQIVARMLEKQGIEAIILSEQTNIGSTIIEKIERNSDVMAAICLFTEDDYGRAREEENMNMRARQNVVFEAGYFIGKLGRQNVILIANEDIELPSDLNGFLYSDKNLWQIEVLRELKEMGFEIDMNKLL